LKNKRKITIYTQFCGKLTQIRKDIYIIFSTSNVDNYIMCKKYIKKMCILYDKKYVEK